MHDHLPVIVANELKQRLPTLKTHTFLFEEARFGVGHLGLDPLRRRVLQRTGELVEEFGEISKIPQIAALEALVEHPASEPELKAYGPRPGSVIGQQLLELAEKRPFPVENDAVDGALLLSLFYRMPVFLMETQGLEPPLMLAECPEPFILPTPSGPRRAPGAPILCDPTKAVRSLQWPIRRSRVHEFVHSFTMVIVDPGVDGGLDPDETRNRVENWMSTLTRACLRKDALSL